MQHPTLPEHTIHPATPKELKDAQIFTDGTLLFHYGERTYCRKVPSTGRTRVSAGSIRLYTVQGPGLSFLEAFNA